jgi:hypothetical protein
MNLSPDEISWLLRWLKEQKKRMPGGQSRGPSYNVAGRDLDEIFLIFREDAVWAGTLCWQVVSERIATGQWPKMKPSHSYWLRQRWLMAERFCRDSLVKAPAAHATKPSNVDATVRWLLIELWDTGLVDLWIRENARDCVYADHFKCEESPGELERYFAKHNM